MNLKKLIYFVVFSLSFSLCYSQKTDEKNKYRRILKLVETNSWKKYFSSSGVVNYAINNDDIYLEYKDLRGLDFENSLSASFVILNEEGSFWEFEINKFEFKKSQINYFKQLAPYGNKETRGFSLGISSRSSYNFNLANSFSKLKLTVGPSAILGYNFKKNAIYNLQYLQDQNIVGLNLGLITRAGYSIGKRVYLEAAVPINIIDLSYGTELINYTVEAGFRSKKFQYFNHFGKKSPDLYSRRFDLVLSLGYKF